MVEPSGPAIPKSQEVADMVVPPGESRRAAGRATGRRVCGRFAPKPVHPKSFHPGWSQFTPLMSGQFAPLTDIADFDEVISPQ